MFGDVAGLGDGSMADLVSAAQRCLVEAETRLLVLAGHWGHRFEADHLRTPHDSTRSLGAAGPPQVNMDAAMEFGTLIRSTTTAGLNMITDALDLEHRLPLLWARVCRGEVRAWKAREIAKRTRHLDAIAAGYVDRAAAPYVVSLAWGRVQDLVEAKIIEADPEQADARARSAAAERFVRTGRSTEQGLRMIFARVEAGDAIWFVAMVDRIATILGDQGDPDPVDVRRSKAIGVMANPAQACQLIASHTRPGLETDAESGSAEPAPRSEPAPEQEEEMVPPAAHPVPPADDAWPVTDPWEHRARIPEGRWRQIHLRHRDDPGPTEPDTSEHADGPAPGTPQDSGISGAADPGRAGQTLATFCADPKLRRRLQPTAVVYVHLQQQALTGACTGVARVEDVGPVTLTQLRRFLGTGRINIRLQPVIDLEQVRSVDCWEIPAWMRERNRLRLPRDVFPYAAGTGRTPDLDHTKPYVPLNRGGPPGQTAETKLGPLSRLHHNSKTRGRWRCRQPVPGVFVWRSPHGQVLIVDADGTHDYGRGRFAANLWHAARIDQHAERAKGALTTAA